MNKLTGNKLVNNNSRLVIFAFVVTIIFQITAYKAIWGIELASRLVNIAAILIFSGYAIYSLFKFKFNENVIFFYYIPGGLVYIGSFINISFWSILNTKVINQYGLLIPWATYLAIPVFVKFGKIDVSSLWRYYHNFMSVVVSISIIEYYFAFEGIVTTRPIVTSGGDFLAGYFSMFYPIGKGELHYRFYASFMEPGTLAMFLLPAMAYAFLHRKYFALVIYFVAMFMSDSLGGFLGVAMLIPLLIYFQFRRGILPIILSILSVIFIVNFFVGEFIEQYEEKGDSRVDREVSTFGAINNLPSLFLEYPWGLPITETTTQIQQNRLYSGANFTPVNAFYLGGILSFLGYLAVLLVSLWYAIISLARKDLSLDEKAAVATIFCLLPFIFQRTVVWDTSIYALMYAPFVINALRGAPSQQSTLI